MDSGRTRTFPGVWSAVSTRGAPLNHCAERLSSLARSYGFDELLTWTRLGGLETKKVLRSMELLSDAVMPRVRKILNS